MAAMPRGGPTGRTSRRPQEGRRPTGLEGQKLGRHPRTTLARGVLRASRMAAAVLLAGSVAVIFLTSGAQGVARRAVKIAASVGSVSRTATQASVAAVNGTFVEGTPAVGALFTSSSEGGLGGQFCTASVVDSPGRDLVVTAAHCVSGLAPGQIAFVPGYSRGSTPYGVWSVRRIILDSAWTSSADPDHDFAFLVVYRPGSQAKVQDVTGGERIAIDQPPAEVVRVIGYPEGDDSPISCENRTLAFSQSQLQFNCGGYADGTSGSPLLVDISPSTGLGSVIGVIGGYQQGGNTSAVSYAARFTASAASLYKSATAAS